MTSGPIGEAHVLVSPDLRGFPTKLRADLNAAIARVREPKIKVQFDIHRGSLTKAIAEANRIIKASKVQAKIEFDLNRGSLNKTITQAKAAARGAGVKVKVDVDDNSIRRTTRSFDLLGGRGRSALRSLNREVFNSNIRLREMANILGGATLPVLVSLASVGVAAFGSLAAAAASAAAAVSVLPGLIGAAIQGLGVGALAFSGLGDAVKAMGAAQESAGTSALSSARKESTAADAIKAAQRGVRDALQGVTDAQKGLNDARRDARQRLIDLRFEEVRLSLDQRGAVLGIKEAEADLREVINDPQSTRLQRERAGLRVEEAKLARQEITRRIALNRQEIRSGVEGSEQVVAARERQRDAAQQLRDAQEQVAKATRSATLATAAAPAPVNKLAQAFAKLSPAGQRFARFLFSLRPRFLELRGLAQAGLFPGLESAISRLVDAHFPLLRRTVDQTARTLGGLAREGAALLSSGPFRRDFAQFASDNVRILQLAGSSSLNLADAFRNVTSAARPLVLTVAAMTLRWSENVKASAAAGRESGRLGRFFRLAGESLASLLRIAGNVGRTLGAVLAAAFPSGAALLTNLEAATGRMRELATSTRGGEALREFFDKARPAVETIAGLLVTMARKLFEIVVHVKTATEAIAEFLDKHPEFKEMVASAAALAFALKALNISGLAGVIGSIGQLIVFNPVLALVVGGVLALGAAFVFAYTHNKPFKEAVDNLARTVKETVLPALKSFGRFINEDVVPALKRAIPFIRDQLVAGLDFLFQAIEDNKPQLRTIGRLLLEIGKFIAVTVIPNLLKLYSIHLRGLFTGLGLVIGVLGVLTRVFRVMVSGVLAGFQVILDSAAAAFGWIPGIGGKLKTARDKFKEFRDKVNESLDGIKDKKVTVTATGALKLPKGMSVRDIVGKATGGPIDGPGPKGRDSVLMWGAPGEHMLTAQEVNQAGGHSAVHALRAAIRQGWRVPGFQRGGAVEDAPRGLRVTASTSTSRLEEGVERFDRVLDRLALTLGRRVADASTQSSGTVSGAKFGGAAMSYIADFIRKAGVAFQIISGFRPGARTRGTGSVSLHALGRALDLVGAGKSSMLDIWRAATRIPFKKEVIFSPAPFQVYGSGKHPGPPTNPRTRADHYNHVHIGLFDQGGFLMPGLTLARNRTGKPERVEPAGKDILGRTRFGQGLHVENLIVQPLAGQFRLADVATELALQGVH